MEDLMNTLILGAVVAAAFPIAFLAARLCLGAGPYVPGQNAMAQVKGGARPVL
jgi:hypothetical protein